MAREESVMSDRPDPSVHDHLRAVDAPYPPGVYRVVGRGEGLRLLRVTDGDGDRVNTGQVYDVRPDDLAGFEPAEDPDAGLSPLSTLKSGVEGVGSMVREILR